MTVVLAYELAVPNRAPEIFFDCYESTDLAAYVPAPIGCAGTQHIVKIRTDQEPIANDEYLSAPYNLAYSRTAAVAGAEARPERTVEIGSGLAIARLSGHDWMYSDVLRSETLTLRNTAEQLPFQDCSLDAPILKDTWHHIPHIEGFLAEAHRVLRIGGTIAVFDPYWSILTRFVYRFLHQERWGVCAPSGSLASTGPWDSNQASTYVMLRRDRQQFNENWGNRFTLTEYGRHIGPSFPLSGGVSRRTPIFHVFGLVKR